MLERFRNVMGRVRNAAPPRRRSEEQVDSEMADLRASSDARIRETRIIVDGFRKIERGAYRR